MSFDRSSLPVVFLDTETTGLEFGVDRVVEIAVVSWRRASYESYCSLTFPGFGDFAWNAMAAHHIRPSDVNGAPTSEDVMADIRAFLTEKGAAAIVAHNAPFDAAFVPELDDIPWIDSLHLARMAWPEAESHKNFSLFHGLELDRTRILGQSSHRALTDVLATSEVFFKAIEVLGIGGPDAIDQLTAAMSVRIPLRRVPFGKHRGEFFENVPEEYLRWIMRTISDRPDVLEAASGELDRRLGKSA